MQSLFAPIYVNGALLVLWGGIIFHFLIPLPQAIHPSVLWAKFADILADKVNQPHHYQQNKLSGALATLLMIVPAAALLIAAQSLVWQPALYQLALLILALGWRNQHVRNTHLIQFLAVEDKPAMRDELATILNRKTDSLSLVGLGKAATETMVIGHVREVITVLFWYGIAGGIGAFLYRLLADLHRSWTPSLSRYHPFGLTAAILVFIAEFIPMRLFSLFMLAGKQSISLLPEIQQQSRRWPSPSTGWLLAVAGCKFQLSLGGPAIYGDTKMIRTKLGGRVVPSAIHLAQIKRMLMIRTWLWILIQSVIMFAVYRGL